MSWLTEPVPGEENHVPAPQPIMLGEVGVSAGVIYDGTFGYEYNGLRTIDLAGTCNWPGLTREDEGVLHRIRTGSYDYSTEAGLDEIASDAAVFDEIVDEATTFLDEHCCPPGWSVQWHEGNLMLATVEEWCEAAGDPCDDAAHVHTVRAL